MPCHWPSQICLLLTPRRGLHRTLTWRQAWHSTFMYHGKRRQKGEITSSWELKNKQQTRNAGTACWASLEGWPRHSRCYKDVLLEPRLISTSSNSAMLIPWYQHRDRNQSSIFLLFTINFPLQFLNVQRGNWIRTHTLTCTASLNLNSLRTKGMFLLWK